MAIFWTKLCFSSFASFDISENVASRMADYFLFLHEIYKKKILNMTIRA